MLLVETKLDVSPIHGIGLYASQFIRKGTVVWRFNNLIDRRFSARVWAKLSPESRVQIEKYSYREKTSRLYVLCGDDARFFNHSSNPNCFDAYSDHEDLTFAARDIQPDEELTCDYALFDLDFVEGKYHLTALEEFQQLSPLH